MKHSLISKTLIGSLTAVGIISLWFWISASLPMQLVERVPGMDKAGAESSAEGSRTGPVGKLIKSDGIPPDLKGAWPCFRGENLDNISKDSFEPVPKGSGFTQLWSIDAGEGFASPVIRDGRVYLMDYDREKKSDALRCLSLADGKEIWRYTYPVTVKRNHGMSRTIPSVTDKYVVSIGPKCHVTCLDSITGEKKWTLDLTQAYNTEVPDWYAGQNPLIVNNRLILAPGGSSLLAAIDCDTGKAIWETPNPNEWKMTHSSVMPMEWNGKKMYVYCANGGVVGVSADDGHLLWENPEWKIRIANVPSPLIVGDGRIFLCGGYQAGSMMLKLDEKDGKIIPNIQFRLKPERFGSVQHTPILYKDFIYGVRPDGQFVCLDLDGNEKWNSTSKIKFGNGSYMMAGSLIYALDDDGLLSRIEATPEAFKLVDQTKVLQGNESWGPIACASGRMIVRDLTKMACIKVSSK